MNWNNLLGKKRGVGSGDELAGIDDLSANDATLNNQKMMLGAGALIALGLGSWYIMSGDDADSAASGDGAEISVKTDDLVNRNMSEQEWMAASENRFQGLENQMKAGEGAQRRAEQLEKQLSAERDKSNGMASDGSRVMNAYQQENDKLRAALAAARKSPVVAAPASVKRPPTSYQSASPSGTRAGDTALQAVGSSQLSSGEVQLVNFKGGSPASGPRISDNQTSYSDSVDYLPPNSIAPAKVIVGVNASAGVSSQSDPLPVVLRITGPARSVYSGGRLLTTKVQGCLVNGAARGDLSSERIYVKLQRMTCPQTNGRYAVSKVKGFIAFGGKTGVRGKVVSREGSLATQAFFAGLIGGFGNALSATSSPLARGGAVIADGNTSGAGIDDILSAGVGGGAAQAGESVSEYLIERAEQYQPIVEMPVGINVEVVFLDGVFIES
tara:strand:- start:54550 stop:55872 length:1323 start_codon:yes stop_codon:yes gene_type:complete